MAVSGSILPGLEFGRAIRHARALNIDSFDHGVETLANTAYSPVGVIFHGNIVEIFRRPEGGFAKVNLSIQEIVAGQRVKVMAVRVLEIM